MNEAERFLMIQLFLAALRDRLAKAIMYNRFVNSEVVMCSKTFARAVDIERKKGNEFAALWSVHSGDDGRRCQEFMDALSYAMRAGVVARPSTVKQAATVLLTPRQVNEILSHNDKYRDGAFALAQRYLRLSRSA